MKLNWRLPPSFVLTLTVLLSGGNEGVADEPGSSSDRLAAYRRHGLDPAVPLESRVKGTAAPVLEMFKELGGPAPKAHVLTDGERKKLAGALAVLPPLHQRVLRERLRVISFLDGMPNTALTSTVNFQEPYRLYDITFNASILLQNVSEWLTQKERTCFDTTGSALSVNVDAGTTIDALVYVFLHEATHVVDACERITPPLPPGKVKPRAEAPPPTSFTAGVWTELSLPVPRFRDPLRERINFYAPGATIPIGEGPALYGWLSRTPFASLYGSRNWLDDIAEYVAVYHLTEMLKQPYRIVIRDAAREVFVHEPMKSGLVRGRIGEIKRFYQGYGAIDRARRPPILKADVDRLSLSPTQRLLMRHLGIVMAALFLQSNGVADEPVSKYRLIAPKDDGIMATGLNDRGDLVGFQWTEEKDQPGVVSQVPFYARGKTVINLPLLKGYTTTHPAAISDTGLVVGRASKPAPPGPRVYLRNQAFIWTEATGIRGLGALPDDSASYACGVTRDGTCISGVTIGDGRIRACVWERVGDAWKGTALPLTRQLSSQVVVMSNNGRYVASIDGTVPCLWARSEQGSWNREPIGEPGSMAPRAVNNSGIVVGLSYEKDAITDAVVWTRGAGINHLEKPKGYVRSQANAINNAGVVVGMVDGPHGSAIGPNAFVYEQGRLRLLDECGPAFVSANAINDLGQVAGDLDKEAVEDHGAAGPRPPRPPGNGSQARPDRPK